jgi:hypothetical protein
LLRSKKPEGRLARATISPCEFKQPSAKLSAYYFKLCALLHELYRQFILYVGSLFGSLVREFTLRWFLLESLSSALGYIYKLVHEPLSRRQDGRGGREQDASLRSYDL